MAKNGYEIRMQGDEAFIDIEGIIGGFDWEECRRKNTGKEIRRKLDALKGANLQTIHVRINSLGGEVNNALQIHDALVEHKAKVIVSIYGYCASAATLIAMAGDERIISENAMFLIHKCWGWGEGNEDELSEIIEEQRRINEISLNIYKKHFKGTEQQLVELFGENYGHGKWLTAKEAVELGFATSIKCGKKKDDEKDKKGMEAMAAMAPMFGLAEIPQITKEDKSLLQTAKEFLGIKTQKKDNNQNQTTPTMKKFLTTFALLGAYLAIKAEQEYDPEKGFTMSEDQMGKLENKLKEADTLKEEKAQLEKDKSTLEEQIETLKQERDSYKEKYEKMPAQTQVPTGKDQQPKEETLEEYIQNSTFYQQVKEEEGIE